MNTPVQIIPALHTPMHENGDLNLAAVRPMLDRLIAEGITGILVSGSTGEFCSLTCEEREAMTIASLQAAQARIPVMIHVGSNSLRDAQRLAAHAEKAGAQSILTIPPCYLKPGNVTTMIGCLKEIASAAPKTPLYYYHIPALTGVPLSMPDLIQQGCPQIPTFSGIKFTNESLFEFRRCLDVANKKFAMFAGRDEMFLGFLATGATAAIGATFNYATPLYKAVSRAFAEGDMEAARLWQSRSAALVHVLRHGGLSASKYIMKLIGLDLGPSRLPLPPLDATTRTTIQSELETIGFFTWRTGQ